MATIIEQKPRYKVLPVVQDVIFTISDDVIVPANFNVKFCAAVHVSNSPITLGNNSDLIGTFKTTPNGEGVGMFNLRSVIETFLKPDYEPQVAITSSKARYKTVKAQTRIFPLHLVDMISMSENSCKFFAVNFYMEYSTTPLGLALSTINNPQPSTEYIIFNGLVKHDDPLTYYGAALPDYGLFLNDTQDAYSGYNLFFQAITGLPHPANFLSDAPTTQHATLDDYGTFAFFDGIETVVSAHRFYFRYYNSIGNNIGNEYITTIAGANGGAPVGSVVSGSKLMYLGAFPANLKNWSSDFATAVTNGLAYYTIEADNGGRISEYYRINILCPNLKGYKPIRLGWLNRWGAWDYYTFNMKSTRTINSKKIPYNQMSGNWNNSTFEISSYKGGKKNFRVNSTEKIKINTDFVTEAEGVWFEQLINSTEVFIIKGYQDEDALALEAVITNKYIEPVILTTSSYTTKTIANDRLMQYTFEIEKSKMERTQAV